MSEENIVKRTDENIKAVCKIMCECDFVNDDGVSHYAEIAGFKPNVKNGIKYLKISKKYTKATYCEALAKVLYKEPPTEIERDKIVADLDFFLNSFGENTHTVVTYSAGLENALKQITGLTKNSQDGLKATAENT